MVFCYYLYLFLKGDCYFAICAILLFHLQEHAICYFAIFSIHLQEYAILLFVLFYNL